MKLTKAATIFGLASLGNAGATDVHSVNNDDWLHQCAQTFQTYGSPDTQEIQRSNHYLIAESSGLCADALSCVFDKCYGYEDLGCLLFGIDIGTQVPDPANAPDLQAQTFNEALQSCGVTSPVALPGSITFPRTAKDVVDAVEFAIDNGLQISIKSTGHCYTGCHTKAGTLMINMRDFAKYAQGDDSVIECTNEDYEEGDACILAKAKDMNAYIRVGGGQTWSDVYNALVDASDAGNTSKLYGVGGGGAGSVGAAGGWLQGGGLSTGYERTYGIGVDQILELEVVLPNASHVRLFPSKWAVDGVHKYPQTQAVSAWCNANISDDESEWDWQPCEKEELDNVTPEDIWRAFRGGGGGTYGIVTSVKYQLFDQKPLHLILGGLGLSTGVEEADANREVIQSKAGADAELASALQQLYTMFLVDLLFNPENVGLTSDFSNHCGGPSLDFRGHMIAEIYCWTEEDAFAVILAAWHRTVDASDTVSNDEELAGLLKDYMFFGDGPYKSYSEMVKTDIDQNVVPPNAVPDSPLPWIFPNKLPNQFCSFNLPLGLLQSNEEDDLDLVYKILSSDPGEHVTGGLVAITGDGMDSIPPSERASGLSSVWIQVAIVTHDILGDLLNSVYKHTDVDGFPGYYEYNHICSDAKTPLRSDWTKECDPALGDDCFSIQEALWGEKLYSTLQDIKAAIDPNNLLDVYPGVKPAQSSSDSITEEDNAATNVFVSLFMSAIAAVVFIVHLQ